MLQDNYSVLKIYASTTDKISYKALYEYIVLTAKNHGISGVTVYRGIMGFGSTGSRVSSSKFLELTDKLPIIIELVEKNPVIENFYNIIEPHLLAMEKGCLVTMQPVTVKLISKGKGTKIN